MNTDRIHRRRSDFNLLAQSLSDDGSIEFWFARDLQEPLVYVRWPNFMTAIQRAVESCETTGDNLNTIFVAAQMAPLETEPNFEDKICLQKDSTVVVSSGRMPQRKIPNPILPVDP